LGKREEGRRKRGERRAKAEGRRKNAEMGTAEHGLRDHRTTRPRDHETTGRSETLKS
jgi:hypothetical protein